METLRTQLLQRHRELRSEFASSWEPTLRDISEQILPYQALWDRQDHNRGDRQDSAIINNTPTEALETLSAGLMAGITSAARRWFRLTTPDPEMAEHGRIREWLHHAEERLRWAFSFGRLYQTFSDGTYRDLGGFGFHLSIFEEDVRRLMRLDWYPVGTYTLAADAQGEVDTAFIDVQMSVRQMAQAFGLEKLSPAATRAYEEKRFNQTFEVVHCIYPNEDYTPGRLDVAGKKWLSRWLEKTDKTDKFLRVRGYEENPIIAPRWMVRGKEAYGRGPGWKVLGDSKALQDLEEKLARLVDKSADPPMNAPEALRGHRTSLVPGDVNYLPGGAAQARFEPAMVVQPGAISAVEKHIDRHERRIFRGFRADVLERLLRDERQQRATATEIEEAREESMLQFGPMLERIGGDMLARLISRGMGILFRAGLLDEPPEELQGTELRIEFESPMHQAQKAVGIQGTRTFLIEVAALAQLKPEAIDKLNADEMVDELAMMTGIKPDLVLTDEQVAEIRAARAAKQQVQAQGEAMLAATQGVKNLATAPAPSQENAAGAIASQFGPVAAAGAGGVA